MGRKKCDNEIRIYVEKSDMVIMCKYYYVWLLSLRGM